jgi:DNA-directed RNA polymerase III subunit RPC1
MMVKPTRDCDVLVNLEMKEKNYDSQAGMKSLCKQDGYVIWRQSELMCGNIAKKTIGDGSKTGLFYVLLQDHGCQNAAKVMNRLAKLCSRYLGGHKGFSIGLDDVTPNPKMAAIKKEIIDEGYRQAHENIDT